MPWRCIETPAPCWSAWSTDHLLIHRQALKHYPIFESFSTALLATRPDLVCIATYSDSHARLAIAALEAGAHVFVEKPLATSLAEAQACRCQSPRHRTQVGCWLYLAPSSVLAMPDRPSALTRWPICVSHEPESAIRGSEPGTHIKP